MSNGKSPRTKDFTLQDLGLAYRKAKVDLYYATHACLKHMVDYEEALEANLTALLGKLNGKDTAWLSDSAFLGDYVLVPTGFDDKFRPASDLYTTIVSAPEVQWKLQKENQDYEEPANIEFRLMAQNSMDFHVLSALWLSHVGDKFDAKLQASARGNRLRRQENGSISNLSVGSFQPYLKPYRDWRDSGLSAIKAALTAKKAVVVLTADIKSYYHRLKPDFMLDDSFQQRHGIKLNERQHALNRRFIAAMKNWAALTPLGGGLPVGLPASAVVANLALLELDEKISSELAPLYYGRYVDDIILVLENTNNFTRASELWQWLITRFDGLLTGEPHGEQVFYRPAYLSGCEIEISRNKSKVFVLDPKTGPYLIDSILQHIQERASEWRALPNLPDSPDVIKADIVQALSTDGEAVDTLGKADKLSTRRAAFAMKLRDFEAYARDLPPEVWEKQRHALFDVAIHNVLVMPVYLDMANYLPRLLRLAIACEDFEHLRLMLDALDKLVKAITDYGHFSIKGQGAGLENSNNSILIRWTDYLERMLNDCMCAAFPVRLSAKGKAAWVDEIASQARATRRSMLTHVAGLSHKEFESEQLRFFSADVAYHPFRFRGLPAEYIPLLHLPAKKQLKAYLNPATFLADGVVVEGLHTLAEWAGLERGTSVPSGILFATRPFALVEVYLLDCCPFHQEQLEKLDKVILALRGFKLTPRWPTFSKQGVLRIPDGNNDGKRRIAVSSWETQEKSWIASVMRQPEPDNTRYQRLMSLVDDVVKKNRGLHYLVLPELSVPIAWYMRLLFKLRNTGISLIAGVEYIHARGRKVRNQVWAALSHDGLDFPTLLIYRQDKQQAALHEERQLERFNHLRLSPETPWPIKGHKDSSPPVIVGPPVIQHGSFTFAMLICSELTNIQYRTALRGNIDALFVPEWNQDTGTFEPLVESAALDIHAYIIQCNDRKYGDSRIRAPYKESWQRDAVRIKGGLHDYFVIGEIDFFELRRFQSSYRSADTPFKPVPDGFVISRLRKSLPK